MSSADKFTAASGSNSNDAFDDLDLESSRRLKRQALLQKRNEEMERRCAERKEKELELQRRRKQKQQQQQQEEQSWQQQLLMSRDLHRKSSEGYNNADDNDTKKSASSSALSPPLSPNLLGPTPPPTPPKTAPKTARTSNRNSRTERDFNDHHLSHLKSLSSTLSSSSPENRASDANNNVTTTKYAPSSPILKNNRNVNHRYNDSPSNTPSPNKVAFRDGTNIKSRYNNGSSYNVSNDKYASSSPPNSMSRKFSKSSYSQLAKKSQIRKRHWQIESDSDDDDEKISFEELARLRRRREKQLSQNSLTAPPAPLQATASTKMSQLSETTNVEEPQKTECTKEQKAAKTVANNNIRWSRYKVDDSSSSEDDLQALRRKFHASKKAKEKDALTQSTVSTNQTNHKHGHTNNNLPFSHLHAASRSSQQQHFQNLKPKPRVLQLTQASSSESDDPEKELIESTKALRAKLQAQQEAKYKHNPVAMAKREEREWNERKVVGATATAKAATVFEGLVGAEIVVRQSEDANDDGNSNDNDGKPRHGDKWKQSRRHSSSNRHFRSNDQNNGEENAISSPGSPLEDTASNKNQCARQLFATRENNGEVDELWDDSDENEGKNNDSESEDDGKGRNKSGGRRGRGSNTSSNQRKRALSQNRSSNGTARSGSPQTKKQISSAKANGRRSTSVDALVQPSDEMDTRDPSRKCAKSCKSISRAASARAEEEEEDEPLSDEEEQRRELKPDFRDPKLGKPSALVPLLLSRTWTHSSNNMAGENSDELEDSDDEKANKKKSALRKDNGDVHQVPASINRYLKEYQREGVQFMYSSVIRGEGCVLGDDMGLGKTVQLISLIAALLKKTGTGMDALEIHRHRRKVTQVCSVLTWLLNSPILIAAIIVSEKYNPITITGHGRTAEEGNPRIDDWRIFGGCSKFICAGWHHDSQIFPYSYCSSIKCYSGKLMHALHQYLCV